MPYCIAVILAGGLGTRAAFNRPKQLTKLGGRPVIAHTIERFDQHEGIDEIVVVSHQSVLPEIEDAIVHGEFRKVARVIAGGDERYESSLAAIRAYEQLAREKDVRLIFHDAVRPLVTTGIIDRTLAALDHYGAVDVVVPATDTIVEADPTSNTIASVPDRGRMRLGQTPQGFHYGVIAEAYRRAVLDPGLTATDDCGIVLKYLPGEPVALVQGDVNNMKLTYYDDLMILDKLLQSGGGKRLSPQEEAPQLARLRSKRIVIFGGTSGIGASMARIARAYGATVLAASRSTGVDVSDGAAVARCLEDFSDEYGGIDAIVASSGVLVKRPFASLSAEELSQSVGTNLMGALIVARIGYDYLKRSRGHLQLFGSSSYTYGRANYAAYSATKAALVNLTQALADEWAPAGIRVNCIVPDRTATPMRTQAFGAEPPESLLSPDDVARRSLAVLLGSVTGHIVDISLR